MAWSAGAGTYRKCDFAGAIYSDDHAGKLKSRMPTAKRLRDFALYLVISTTFIFVAIGGAILSGKSGPSFLKWVEFAGFTAVLFGYWIAENSTHLKQRSFWMLTLLVLLIHVVGGTFALINLEWVKPMWFVIITVAELAMLMQLRTWFLRPLENRKLHARRDDQ
jgi:hypothetical protein